MTKKLPIKLATYQKENGIVYTNLLSVNPKTKKSEVETRILHLAPSNISGNNVCPGAGNCKSICLHFAGNPAYQKNKFAARIRRTDAFFTDRTMFAQIVLLAILYNYNNNNKEKMAIRLNGTSDIKWEYVGFIIDEELSEYIEHRFGYKMQARQYANLMDAVKGLDIVFYDYTKIRREWGYCKEIGYDLTFSFDGWSNASNLKLCEEAFRNGMNIAAAFDIKKNRMLPDSVISYLLGGRIKVYDGDKSDYRINDPKGVIIGLRFKNPVLQNKEEKENAKKMFCWQ